MDVQSPSPPGALPSYGVIDNADGVTEIVLKAMAGAPNPRLRELMAAFVRHLHAFAREVGLTQDEYDFAIDFLNRIGKATHDAHNEGILFADAVGFSTLVCLMNNGGTGATEEQDRPPFSARSGVTTHRSRRMAAASSARPRRARRCSWIAGLPIRSGVPIPGVEVDVWQASPIGLYEKPGCGPGRHEPARAIPHARGRAVLVPLVLSQPAIPCRPRAQPGTCCARSTATPIGPRTCTCSASSPAIGR